MMRGGTNVEIHARDAQIEGVDFAGVPGAAAARACDWHKITRARGLTLQ
jgi:hypothetical protein